MTLKPITQAQKDAVLWLFRHGSEGGFMAWPQHQVLLAGGEVAPIMYSTWTALAKRNLIVKEGKRIKLTEEGRAMAVYRDWQKAQVAW